MKSSKHIFICQSCGHKAYKWLGKCPACNEWDTFTETIDPASLSKKRTYAYEKDLAPDMPVAIDSIEDAKEMRLLTGIKEFDRVLGGGLVSGTLILIGGDPGIGKSTLMLQALHRIAQMKKKVFYVSGEESVRQLNIRAKRLSALSSSLLVVSEINLQKIFSMIDSIKPSVIAIDSIQTMFSDEITSAPGSISQVREAAMKLLIMAKKTGIPTFLIGHVTKEGVIAGPRILEHMVDTVLYFEGDRNHVFRILRAVKNRFGSTNEIGVFEMREEGLDEVPNPSTVFLSERPENTPGSVVTASMEGTRPFLIEIQGLASKTTYATPRRTVLGLDPNRVALLVAVMEKKLGMHLNGHDIFMNVAGRVKIDEPAVDLGIVAAIASSFLNKSVSKETIALGEVGLTGEVRGIGHIETRILEARKMGFTRCLIPKSNLKRIPKTKGLAIVGISTITDAMDNLYK